MPNSFLIGWLAACVVLGVVALARAIAEFGHSGLIAFLKILFGPAFLALWWVLLIVPRFENGALGGILPSRAGWRRTAVFVIVTTAVGLALSGAFGLGWLVSK